MQDTVDEWYGLKLWGRLVIGQLQAEDGKTLEETYALALQYRLKDPAITAEKIRLQQTLVDVEGLVFAPGCSGTVDIIVDEEELVAFAVSDIMYNITTQVDGLAARVKLLTAQQPDKTVRGLFLALLASNATRQHCAAQGIELVEWVEWPKIPTSEP